jgi:hypothetical protein
MNTKNVKKEKSVHLKAKLPLLFENKHHIPQCYQANNYNSPTQKVEIKSRKQQPGYQELKNRRKLVQNRNGFFPQMYILQEVFSSILDVERCFPTQRETGKV